MTPHATTQGTTCCTSGSRVTSHPEPPAQTPPDAARVSDAGLVRDHSQPYFARINALACCHCALASEALGVAVDVFV
jgi:hypothetical protein